MCLKAPQGLGYKNQKLCKTLQGGEAGTVAQLQHFSGMYQALGSPWGEAGETDQLLSLLSR